MITGARGADRGRMREAYGQMTGADPMTGLSSSIYVSHSLLIWERNPGRQEPVNEDEIIVEVTMAVNPAIVWKNLLEPTTNEVFDLPKGKKGTSANVWGDMFMSNETASREDDKGWTRTLSQPSRLCFH